jgi:hypothetical protein
MPADNDVGFSFLLGKTHVDLRYQKTPTPLTSIVAIQGLVANELRDYCRGYYGNKRYPAGAPGHVERLADLCRAIGCTVEAKPPGAD